VRGQRHAPAAPYPRERPGTHLQEAVWAPGTVWTGVETLAPTGIRSPDRPARRQSLYRLFYPAHLLPLYVLKLNTLHFGDRIGLPLQVFYSLRSVVPDDFIHSDYTWTKINTIAEVILFADDTNFLVSHDNYSELKNVVNSVLLHISERFRANHLTLNVERTNIVRFASIKLVQNPVNLVCTDQTLTELDNLKFLGLHTVSHFTWKFRIDLLFKFRIACFVVK
jgi:hypothetical protein